MTEPETTKGDILFIDDDKFLVDMYSLKFTTAGYSVQACVSVHDALEALRNGFAADAIIFDIIMPDQDGFSLLEALKRENLAPNATLIALTNQSDGTEKEKVISHGADRYIVKASMIPSEVVSVVEEEIVKKKS